MDHSLHSQLRPDNRIRVWIDEAWTAEAARAAADLARDRRMPVLVELTGDALASVELLAAAGFEVTRQETHYRLPLAAALANLPTPSQPDDYRIISAADTDVCKLHRLDEELRTDIPGTEGWRTSLHEFREYTFDSRQFHRRTYLVAVDDDTEEYLGLARVWIKSGGPRLGMVGVAGGHRRRGVASMLLAHALSATAEVIGADAVSLEIDNSNVASVSLFTGLGAIAVGSITEMMVAPPRAQG